jgi:hypothetical protein
MNPWYRRMQLISTLVMLLPSAGLLALGYSFWTSARHSRGEAVVLFVLGVALPPLIYFAWTGILWMKRGALPDADPTSLSARVAKKPVLVLLVVGGVAFGFVSFLNGFANAVSGGGDPAAGFARMRSSCVSSAASSVRQKGADPSASPLKEKLDRYCGCVVDEIRAEYTTAEQAEAVLTQGLKDPKMRQLIARCQQQAGLR